jgi:hypothetical protein
MGIEIASLLLSRRPGTHWFFAVAVMSRGNFDGRLGTAHTEKIFLFVRTPDKTLYNFPPGTNQQGSTDHEG